jgi:phosphoglucomutase
VRYDYEGVDADAAKNMMTRLTEKCNTFSGSEVLADGYELSQCDEFEYLDPVDGSVSSHQGWRFIFKDGSRFVFRLSGTGSVGATIRLYLEKYVNDPALFAQSTQETLGEMVNLALEYSQLKEFTGREEPSVIT